MTTLITGAAGFIGFHLAKKILAAAPAKTVIGFDNLNDYYDIGLKEARLNILRGFKNFIFIKGDLAAKQELDGLFAEHTPDIVVNLAAQVGVRYSLTHPETYISSNISGFFNILEACRNHQPRHLVYASSSSVYGANKKVPYSIADMTDRPVSLYAATKKSNELMAYAYAKLYDINMTGLRFFTVYGEYGRPDMAYYSFTEKMVKGETIKLYGNGEMYRDFTYIDDVTESIVKVMDKPAKPDDDGVCHQVYNIGNSKPEKLTDFTAALERILKEEGLLTLPVKKEFLPMQRGDVFQTFADTLELEKDFGYKPKTPIADGLRKFARWYKMYNEKLL